MAQFRVVHLIYIISLLAASLATFGACGLVPGITLSLFWSVVYMSPSRPTAFRIASLVLLLGCGCAGLLLPTISTNREAARRMQCSNNMKQIVLALQYYYDEYKCFPPAYVPDENGKPMHSWRVLILPYIEQQTLYDAYDFNEPWDGPNNGKLLASTPPVLRCPSAAHDSKTPAHSTTDYFAIIGPRAAWQGPRGRTLTEFTDSKPTTIVVIEAPGQNVQWTEPRDLTIDEVLRLVESSDHPHPGDKRTIALVDGNTHHVNDHLPRDLWSNLLTIDDGAQVSEADILQQIPEPSKSMVGLYIRLGIWIVLVLFPIPWVWRRPEVS